ncbi:MAG: helix-turn-helix transcriptional regulator [Myxococcales bacterium]
MATTEWETNHIRPDGSLQFEAPPAHPMGATSTADAWQRLVEGHWSLVEQGPASEPARYRVLVNPPPARAARALTLRESTVVSQMLEGRSAKSIAYALGVQASRVSEAFTRAVRKLGFRNRQDLLRVGGALRAPHSLPPPPSLTHSEAAVLQLLKEGYSNRAIAQRRGVSERTIEHQVASLLRKTGAGSRRVLIVRLA